MFDAAREAINVSAGKSKDDIESERLLNLSLVRLLEIIGEAASKVSANFRSQYTAIPWAQITGMRNRLIHGYVDIDFDILYQTITEDLPPLINELERILESIKISSR